MELVRKGATKPWPAPHSRLAGRAAASGTSTARRASVSMVSASSSREREITGVRLGLLMHERGHGSLVRMFHFAPFHPLWTPSPDHERPPDGVSLHRLSDHFGSAALVPGQLDLCVARHARKEAPLHPFLARSKRPTRSHNRKVIPDRARVDPAKPTPCIPAEAEQVAQRPALQLPQVAEEREKSSDLRSHLVA